jgi:putative transposase
MQAQNRKKSKTTKKRQNTKARPHPAPAPNFSLRRCLRAFKRLLCQTHLKLALEKENLGFYDSIFTPVVTLWCMIFQRLNHDHTLQAAVINAHHGGADRLGSKNRSPLSERIKSLATTAFSNARQRLPLSLLASVLSAQAQEIWEEASDAAWLGWRVLLLDGSQISLRPFPEILNRFEQSGNQRGKAYWALMRVVVTFCLHTGIAIASAAGPASVSEQALACQQILSGPAGCLYLGDRNFGIFWVVQCVLAAKGQCLFRLTKTRARRLAGSGRRLRRPGDYLIHWMPSDHDLRRQGCCQHPLEGRLIVIESRRPGFRTQWLYLWTTLLDAQKYSATQLAQLYATRWQIELDLRHVKTDMDLEQLECKSADMAEKEWLAGLMAYNLVRAIMMAAALKEGIQSSRLSFCATRRLLIRWLTGWSLGAPVARSWEKLLSMTAKIRQPKRAKPRPAEPRAKRHKRESFPPLRGSRALARKNLKKLTSKN